SNFKVLRNVDITFEEYFEPKVFPVGSVNGGGKSTLLQLIYGLLACSFSEQSLFIENLLDGYEVDESKSEFCRFELLHDGENLNLSFHVFTGENIKRNSGININSLRELPSLAREQNEISETIGSFQQVLPLIKKMQESKSDENFVYDLSASLFEVLRKNLPEDTLPSISQINPTQDLTEFVLNQYNNLENEFREIASRKLAITEDQNNLALYKEETGLDLIGSFINSKGNLSTLFIKGDTPNTVLADSFQTIHPKINIVLPKTQTVFLLPKTIRKISLSTNPLAYEQQLRELKKSLPTLSSFGLFDIEFLLTIIKKSREKDIKTLHETGEYGTAYKTLLEEFQKILPGKNIRPNKELNEIHFYSDDTQQQISPEELSHGELKRFSLYLWIKENQVKDSVVLIDEIENTFHPDWQAQIVRDLVEWEPTNQYILATHSYELCEAVSPDHVKEIGSSVKSK
ncbi:MAG: ATP-binding protein, partial [Okeania sp. SIO3C4]|nr:ATP-binding protein [Okeania sp. SIO3C4]